MSRKPITEPNKTNNVKNGGWEIHFGAERKHWKRAIEIAEQISIEDIIDLDFWRNVRLSSPTPILPQPAD